MRCKLTVLALTLTLLTALPAAAGDAAAAFEQLRGLAGNWQGTNARGNPVEIDFELVSGGTAVLERLAIEGERPHDMITLYHLDGDELVLTHYCEAGNQPRMKAVELGDGRLAFDFVDATGLASPDDGHMHSMVMQIGADGRLQSAWTWRENGENKFQEVINLSRAR